MARDYDDYDDDDTILQEVSDEPKPVVLRATGRDAERVHLFTLVDDDGNEREYYGRKKVGFNTSLKAMNVFVERGEGAAEAFALKAVLGEEAYQALMNFEELEQEDFESIMEYAQKVVIAPANRGKGNRASRRARTGGRKSRG